MITRIVRMSFQPEKVSEFLTIFSQSMSQIRGFEGCHHLNLHQDMSQNNVFYTVSHWETESHLEAYRESELFNQTWKKVKPLFNDRAKAYSLSEKIA
ncbi:MAG: putative quinol monooxygenase [Bacteroidota bacterium]